MKRNTIAWAVNEQVLANRSGVGHTDSFEGHRQFLTNEIVRRAPSGGAGRLCLLGAGNAHDVDLPTLAACFAEIHLVDVDAEALQWVRSRVSPDVRDRLLLHAPVELSGTWDRLAEWGARPAPVQSLAGEVQPAVARVLGGLPAAFDVVVSCCMLTQQQLVLLEMLGEGHAAFDTLRAATGAIHVRVMAGLLGPAGRGLLVTDLTSDATYPLDVVSTGDDLGKLMTDLVASGNVIHAAHPGLLSSVIRRDPELAAAFDVRFPVGPWLWQNGPERIFLVYGLEISRRVPPRPWSPP